MATPKTLIILLLFLGVISACPDGECRQLFFRADFTFGNRRLIKHFIESVNVRDFDNCELRCYHQPNCVSINFNVTRDSGFHKCELNNATHRGHDNELENKDGYIYKGTESACDKGPCQNNGTCQSGYTDKGYRCLCPPQWTSDHCEQDVNECQNGQTNLCDKDAICNNTKGSYSCHCKQGFVGDGSTCTSIIPHPSAWFPLNYTYKTSEIENRTTSGSKHGKVHLSLGPDGTPNGSYFFRGSSACSINFFGSNSKLDIGVSITILFWLYNYDNNAETTFLQYKGMKLVVKHTQLKLTFSKSAISKHVTGTLAERGWTFVGVSYNGATVEAKLWINGNMVSSKKTTAIFTDSQFLKLGGSSFKGKITQLMLFNLTLTQEQITEIKGRMKLPAMIFDSAIISNNTFYRAELASFLAPAVNQMESKWKLCHSALTNDWGNDLLKFHRNCDNEKHTVTIIEKKPYIFGGYTDIPWDPSHQNGETLKAFIFSLNNGKALPPFKCLAEDKSNAIFKGSDYGPSFGDGPFWRIQGDQSMAHIPSSYRAPMGVDKNTILVGTDAIFSPNNYEVFYLV